MKKFNTFIEMYSKTHNFGYPGFHGDINLINLIMRLGKTREVFIETGTFFGHTSFFVGKNLPHLDCFTCEINFDHYLISKKTLDSLDNVKIFNSDSILFFKNIISDPNILKKKGLFWLDAHGYGFDWPLKKEIEIITKNFKNYYIFVDDFKVPGLEKKFHYDKYKSQECSYEYIKDNIFGKNNIFYPSYNAGTSYFEPPTGWCLITDEQIDLNLNNEITLNPKSQNNLSRKMIQVIKKIFHKCLPK
jgi:hypothetical protein